jgi:hypothetical protein
VVEKGILTRSDAEKTGEGREERREVGEAVYFYRQEGGGIRLVICRRKSLH